MSTTTTDTLPPGAHAGIPAPRYHAIKAASASQLRVIHNQTPAHLKHREREPFVPTWETILGELIHHAILEPGRPFPQLAVVPETYIVPAEYKGGLGDPKPGDVEPWNWRRKYCQNWKREQEAAGRIVVTQDDLAEIERAVERVHDCPEARELIEGANTEVTLIWEAEDGFPCKARLDLVPRGPVLADIKTCADASPDGFARHAWDMGYHLQAAWYLIGWELCGANAKDRFQFIAYERGVGLVKVHECSADLLRIGREQALRAFEAFRSCSLSGEWPGYSPGLGLLDVPAWKRKEVGL